MIAKIKYLLVFLGLLLMTRCANMVTPTGGPKDITPPKVVKAEPENHTVNFNGRKIEITFDEYITLDNAQQQVLFSPPLSAKPDIKLSNKTVIVKFKEALLPNTTYTIHFGSSIKDLHEGNLFKDYVYSFSTGEVLDTLSIGGKVLDAEEKKPLEDFYVCLYDSGRDSLFEQPLRRVPDFLTKTDKDGKFLLNGLPDKEFLVFALKDMNANLYYDMPNEMVAFLDTMVAASYSQAPLKTPSDTIPTPTDSIVMINDDSLIFRQFDQGALNLTLYAFTEEDTTQMLLEKKLVEEGLLRFVFRHPADSVRIETPDILADSFQLVKVWSIKHDTLWWYFCPGIMDSLLVQIQYDTLINDSTRYSLNYRESKHSGRKEHKILKINNNLKNNLLLPGDDLELRFPEPVAHVQWHDTSTFTIGEETRYEIPFEQADENGMVYRLNTVLSDTLTYAINLTDSVFFSVRGRTNDSLSLRFRRALEKDIGNIFITVAPPEETQLVIQLLDSRNRVVETRIVDQEQRIEFPKLMPEKYKLRAIIDKDRNGVWSTGNYHRLFLPENVVDYKDELDLKAGWDIDLEEKWILFSK
ncbi:MAG: Ig-like domain-containing protein [Bacteroidales bacterium]|nr:Ig-like domain-containing protein [Bacteroidales bacterium]